MKLTQTTGPTLEGRNQKEERIQREKETSNSKFKKKYWKGREILYKWRNKLET